MRNITLILKQEIKAVTGKRSFWIMTFVFPAFVLLLNVGMQVMATNTFGNSGDSFLSPGGEEGQVRAGYVDQAGLIAELPPAVPSSALQAYASEEAAQTALAEREIDHYYLIPADYLEVGELILVEREFRPFGNAGEALMSYVLNYNLTGDAALAAALLEPMGQVEAHSLAPAEPAEANSNSMLAYVVPFLVLFIFFFLITMSSGYMLRSVSREKENRTMEVLLLSVRPRELMLGKILGLSVVALFQMAVWVGGGVLILNRGQQLLDMAGSFSLPSGFLFWALIYFLLGYLLYAALMGALGAMAPNAREAGQFTFIVLLPLMIPLWLNASLLNDPSGTLAVAFSLFPLTAPMAMMTRLASGSVPLWQLAASTAALALTTYALILFAARFFRADTLLSPAALHWGRLRSEWRSTR